MLRRWFVTAGIIVWSGLTWTAALASAQDLASPLATAMPKLTFATSVTAPAATPVASEAAPIPMQPSFAYGSSSFKTMAPFYGSTALLQILDFKSTMAVIKQGGYEANPLLKGVVGHPALFMGVKAAVAAASIYSASKLARHNKVAAIATMVAMNSAYAMVVEHNFAIARTMAAK